MRAQSKNNPTAHKKRCAMHANNNNKSKRVVRDRNSIPNKSKVDQHKRDAN